jgi:hypothetical protein
MLDELLDEYEALWRGGSSPRLEEFFVKARAATPADQQAELATELAIIDLQRRWQLFHAAPGAASLERPRADDSFPLLPTWEDYCKLLPIARESPLGVFHEFRARQTLGDAPDYREFLAKYPQHAEALSDELPEIAAELSAAVVKLWQNQQAIYSCRLPGRLEVGRRRRGEPRAPAITGAGRTRRLLAAERQQNHLSRKQFSIEVVAINRISIQHHSPRGYLRLDSGPRLEGSQECTVPLPCLIQFGEWAQRIEPAVSKDDIPGEKKTEAPQVE